MNTNAMTMMRAKIESILGAMGPGRIFWVNMYKNLSNTYEAIGQFHDTLYENGFVDNNEQKENKDNEENNEELRNRVVADINEICGHTFFTDFTKELDIPTSDTKCIVGNVQSGKSAVICGIAVYNAVVLRKTTIVVLRNLTDGLRPIQVQIHRRRQIREIQCRHPVCW